MGDMTELIEERDEYDPDKFFETVDRIRGMAVNLEEMIDDVEAQLDMAYAEQRQANEKIVDLSIKRVDMIRQSDPNFYDKLLTSITERTNG